MNFNDLDAVIALLWHKAGEGTREEIDSALEQLRENGRPSVFIFRKIAGMHPESREEQALQQYCSGLISNGTVVTEFRETGELTGRVIHALANHFARPAVESPAAFSQLKRAFLVSGAISAIFTATTLLVSRIMSFSENNVSFFNVLWILAAPPVLAVMAAITFWLFARLMTGISTAWHSPQYRDQELYQAFRSIIPAHVLPARLRNFYPAGMTGDFLRWLLLAIMLAGPALGQYEAIFEEILTWEYVVGSDTVPEQPAESARQQDSTVRSAYVDQRNSIWPLGLQDPQVRNHYKNNPNAMIFVHARGKFQDAATLPRNSAWRANTGPQVWMPAQPVIYIGLFLAVVIVIAAAILRLLRIRSEMTARMPDCK